MKKFAALALFSILIFLAVPSFAIDEKLIERLELSGTAFRELMQANDQSIPYDLLKNCEAVVIFPRTLNIAWGIGGQYGKGVALRHDKKNKDWSAPAFYTIGGLTIGPQIGGQAIDIVLIVMNEKGLDSLLKSKCTLGGDAGIALGPVGRNATASTDLGLKAEIYSYSRARGLYIGLSLKGAMVKPDKSAIIEYYGADYTARDILIDGKGSPKKYAQPVLNALRKYTPGCRPCSLLSWLGMAALVTVAALFVAAFFLRKK